MSDLYTERNSEDEILNLAELDSDEVIFYLMQDTKCLKEDIQKLQAENEQLKKQSKWISVEDELPEINQRVLTFRPDILDVDRFRFCRFGRKGFASVYKVTHWMPLPTPPEGE